MLYKEYALNRVKLFAMSDKREEALQAIKSSGREIVKHIVKRLIVVNTLGYNHWNGEITDFIEPLLEIKTKPRNRKLDSKTFVSKLKDNAIFKNMDRTVLIIKRDYGAKHKIRNWDTGHLKEVVSEILEAVGNVYKHIDQYQIKSGELVFDINNLEKFSDAVAEAEKH